VPKPAQNRELGDDAAHLVSDHELRPSPLKGSVARVKSSAPLGEEHDESLQEDFAREDRRGAAQG
jgi:hypothetical protein